MHQFMIQDIEIKSLPVGIVTDSHTDLTNLEKLKSQYSQLICLGDFTSTKKIMGHDNDISVTAFRESGIPCLRGNHEEFIRKVKTGTWPLPFAYSLSRENRKFIASLPIGFRLLLPNGDKLLCFHNRPNEVGGASKNPWDVLDLIRDYPIDCHTTAVLTGHTHTSLIRGYKELDVKFVRCASLQDGGYAEIDENGKVRLKHLFNSLSYEVWWKNYCDKADSEAIRQQQYGEPEFGYPDLGDFPYYDEKEGRLILPC